MPDRLEPAASGRARCRACGAKIEKGALRFGEELPNAYGEGDDVAVYWFHPRCAAHRRPEKFAPFARDDQAAAALPDRAALLAEAEFGIAHERLTRVAGAERSPSGRAKCRHCAEAIPQGEWRIILSTFGPSGFFDPLGFIHARCAAPYLGMTATVRDRLQQASAELDAPALDEITAAVGNAPG